MKTWIFILVIHIFMLSMLMWAVMRLVSSDIERGAYKQAYESSRNELESLHRTVYRKIDAAFICKKKN